MVILFQKKPKCEAFLAKRRNSGIFREKKTKADTEISFQSYSLWFLSLKLFSEQLNLHFTQPFHYASILSIGKLSNCARQIQQLENSWNLSVFVENGRNLENWDFMCHFPMWQKGPVQWFCQFPQKSGPKKYLETFVWSHRHYVIFQSV